MKYLLALWMFIHLSCNHPATTTDNNNQVLLPPHIEVDASNPFLHNANGTWMFKDTAFSGFIVQKENNRLMAKLSVVAGKENGAGYEWYKNGKLKTEKHFMKGDREGFQKGWYENDSLAYQLFFHQDKYEGTQMYYYPSGHIWQMLNYTGGETDGKQKTWSDSGRVINNFTVKNKRLYGVIGRYDCMSVHKR